MLHAKPTVLIGVSGQAGLFSEGMIRTMHAGCDKPVIFPLSNPSKQVEALPEQLIHWTEGQAIIATGSPFKPVQYKQQKYIISQCNNSYIFPGIGLAVVAGQVERVTDEMMMVASEVLASRSPLAMNGEGALLPPLANIMEISQAIALQVILLAQTRGLAPARSDHEIKKAINTHFWLPVYRDYHRVSI